jgi:hypothetical protein
MIIIIIIIIIIINSFIFLFPYYADFKNYWSYTSNPPYVFKECTRTTFTFSCYFLIS